MAEKLPYQDLRVTAEDIEIQCRHIGELPWHHPRCMAIIHNMRTERRDAELMARIARRRALLENIIPITK